MKSTHAQSGPPRALHASRPSGQEVIVVAKTFAKCLVTLTVAAGCSGGLVATRSYSPPPSGATRYQERAAERQRQDERQRAERQQAYDDEVERRQIAARQNAVNERAAQETERQRLLNEAESARLDRERGRQHRTHGDGQQASNEEAKLVAHQAKLNDSESQKLLAKLSSMEEKERAKLERGDPGSEDRSQLHAKQRTRREQEIARLQQKQAHRNDAELKRLRRVR